MEIDLDIIPSSSTHIFLYPLAISILILILNYWWSTHDVRCMLAISCSLIVLLFEDLPFQKFGIVVDSATAVVSFQASVDSYVCQYVHLLSNEVGGGIIPLLNYVNFAGSFVELFIPNINIKFAICEMIFAIFINVSFPLIGQQLQMYPDQIRCIFHILKTDKDTTLNMIILISVTQALLNIKQKT